MTDAFFREWLDYFRWNAEEPDTFPWQSREALAEGEAARLGKSIATFQLGENSEGSALLKFAKRYGDEMGFALLPSITALFVAEERNHSALLARFMDKHGIPRRASDWTDAVFRRLRRPFGFEASLSVLITAEIIALVYYRALREATTSRLLRAICNKILEDEKSHVEYESALIRFAQAGRGPSVRALWRLGHRLLFAGTSLVVYREHRAVLAGGGCPFRAFSRACRAEFLRLFPESAPQGTRRSGAKVADMLWRKG
ncbi:MAG TPA: ferritin-like domain-containing protein [Fibrobacteria bacterium]|nr:ferritin-like domain-containing protein [Fibrobacteria bacterium]